MVKASKRHSNFNLVPIGFIAACIAAAGGFDYSDPKHADVLTTLAIESKIYLVVDELYAFIGELKYNIFQFLMNVMGWKRHSRLVACGILREIIDAVDSIDAIKTHPSLKFICLPKHSTGSISLNSIIEGTDEVINESYELHDLKKGRFTKEDKIWIDKAMMRDLDKLLDDSISVTEKTSIVNKQKKYLDSLHRKLADNDVYQWVSELKLAVYDEKLRPKMNEFWFKFNKEANRDPTQNFGPWVKNYFSQYTDISKPIKEAQIYNFMQESLQLVSSKPFDKIPEFKIPNIYSLNAAFSKNSNKGKNRRNKSHIKKTEDIGSSQTQD